MVEHGFSVGSILSRGRMKHAAASVVTMAWLVCASAAPAPDGIGIDLNPQVGVHDAQVTLGEVAQIRTSEPLVLAGLSKLPLGRAPLAGEHVTLRRDVLQRWIVARTAIDPQRISWSDTATSKIRLATQMLSG